MLLRPLPAESSFVRFRKEKRRPARHCVPPSGGDRGPPPVTASACRSFVAPRQRFSFAFASTLGAVERRLPAVSGVTNDIIYQV